MAGSVEAATRGTAEARLWGTNPMQWPKATYFGLGPDVVKDSCQEE